MDLDAIFADRRWSPYSLDADRWPPPKPPFGLRAPIHLLFRVSLLHLLVTFLIGQADASLVGGESTIRAIKRSPSDQLVLPEFSEFVNVGEVFSVPLGSEEEVIQHVISHLCGDSLQTFVRTLTSPPFTLELAPNCFIENIKQKIQDEEGHLVECDFDDDNTQQMVLRLDKRGVQILSKSQPDSISAFDSSSGDWLDMTYRKVQKKEKPIEKDMVPYNIIKTLWIGVVLYLSHKCITSIRLKEEIFSSEDLDEDPSTPSHSDTKSSDDNQKTMHESEDLDEDFSVLSDTDEEPILHFVLHKCGKSMRTFVRTLTSRIFILDLGSNRFIEDIKQKIQNKEGRFAECQFGDDNTLELVLRSYEGCVQVTFESLPNSTFTFDAKSGDWIERIHQKDKAAPIEVKEPLDLVDLDNDSEKTTDYNAAIKVSSPALPKADGEKTENNCVSTASKKPPDKDSKTDSKFSDDVSAIKVGSPALSKADDEKTENDPKLNEIRKAPDIKNQKQSSLTDANINNSAIKVSSPVLRKTDGEKTEQGSQLETRFSVEQRESFAEKKRKPPDP